MARHKFICKDCGTVRIINSEKYTEKAACLQCVAVTTFDRFTILNKDMVRLANLARARLEQVRKHSKRHENYHAPETLNSER